MPTGRLSRGYRYQLEAADGRNGVCTTVAVSDAAV
jgi:hypothetical protein